MNHSVNSYNNSNQHTDKFFVPPSSKSDNQITLMNGQVVNSDTFKHNNMQPYFGAKIRGATSDFNNTESNAGEKIKINKDNINRIYYVIKPIRSMISNKKAEFLTNSKKIFTNDHETISRKFGNIYNISEEVSNCYSQKINELFDGHKINETHMIGNKFEKIGRAHV